MPHSVTQITVRSTNDLPAIVPLLASFPVRVAKHASHGGDEALTAEMLPQLVERCLRRNPGHAISIYVPEHLGSANDEGALRKVIKKYGYPLAVRMALIGAKTPTPWTLLDSDADLAAYVQKEGGKVAYIDYRRPLPAN